MEYGISDILKLLGSLVLFLYGMKLMSESLQKVAGDKMRSILAAMTSNRFKGILTGVLITAVIQSSSATTVMLVSFVNAGLINLMQAIGVIMGANIGTTITAWLISILGFKVQISQMVLPLLGLALPLIFSKNRKWSNWGAVLIGFAIIFIGLDFLKGSTPDINNNPQLLEFLSRFSDWGYASILIYLLIGTILTVVIQSSSAVMALTLVMCFNGWLSFEMAAAMVLGENIGTTITANLAALIANTSAKRTARAHLIFNVLGVIIVVVFFFPFLRFIDMITVGFGFDSPIGSVVQTSEQTMEAIPVGLSIFHSTFNIMLTSLLVWFVPIIEKLVVWLVPHKEDDEEFRLQYISMGLLSTNELSILQATKESLVFAKRVRKMFDFVKTLIIDKITKKNIKLINKIIKYEEISDRMEIEIASYLTKITEESISHVGSEKINSILYVVSKIESIADSCHTIAKTIDRKIDQKIGHTDEMVANFAKLLDLCTEQFDLLLLYMNSDNHIEPDQKMHELHTKMNKLLKKLQTEHFKNLKNGLYKTKEGVIYSDIYNELGNIGEYTYEINEQLVGINVLEEVS
jgi:phosphate:Na+ symporter